MLKIGKTYNLFSTDSLEANKFYNILLSSKDYGLTLHGIEENYNDKDFSYSGSITITGDYKDLKCFIETEDFKNTVLQMRQKVSVNFLTDTHYEQLLEIKNANIPDQSLQLLKFKSKFEYNFLIKNYEDYLLSNDTILETALPYYYEVLSNMVLEENYNGFEGTSFFENPSSVIQSKFRNDLITNVIPSEVVIEDKKLEITKYLQKFNMFKEQFPFYTDISFDTHHLDQKSICKAIQDKNLFPEFFETVAQDSIESTLTFTDNQNNLNINVKELDITNFLTKKLDYFADNNFSFIFDINQRVDDKSRSFLEILQNKSEYVEVVGYHLKKYLGDSNTLIQEWYFPNTSEETFNWVDTQIKYDKKYTYKLDLIVLSFATLFSIDDVQLKRDKLILTFTNKPLIKTFILSNIPSFGKQTLGATYTNFLLDFPPIEPEVEFTPYIDVPDKVKINLNTATGLKTVQPIIFSSAEEQNILKIKQSQDISSEIDLITFQSDEPSSVFDIYRIDYKPKSYEDFFNSILTTISTNNASGASYIDKLESNKKYYYTCRSRDYHNNRSNPTPVYEVEIINDNGLVLPMIHVVDFETGENNKKLFKEVKSLLKIQPAIRHRLINNEKTNENNVELGSDQIAPWNQKFKIRLTSKSTGRKIDINVRFKYNKPT